MIVDLTLRCPTCGQRADMCFAHGDDWKQRPMQKVRDALIVLSGHLPLFSADRRKVARAEEHLSLRAEAFDALDRIADELGLPHVARRMRA